MRKIDRLCKSENDEQIKEDKIKRTINRIEGRFNDYFSNIEEAIEEQQDLIEQEEAILASSPKDFDISGIDEALATIRELKSRKADLEEYKKELFKEVK